MTPWGFELPPDSKQETPVSGSRGNKSGNNPAGSDPRTAPATHPPTPADPDLAAVIAAWPDLPPAVRAGVVAMVRAAGGVR